MFFEELFSVLLPVRYNKNMGYAIAGLYVFLVGMMTQLFIITEKVGRLESKVDNLVPKTELEEVKRRVEILEKKIIGSSD